MKISFKKKKRDGFTLVELLVVIGILAVLASVSVIGYLGFVKKARVSNDTGIVAQMNTTLQANEVGDGQNNTAYEAVEEILDAGLDVSKLSPTTQGYNYAFDISQNRMFLLDENYKQIAPENITISSKGVDVFVLAGSDSEVSTLESKGYSAYLKDGFSWTDQSSKVIYTSKGIDVGNNSVDKIYYINESEQSVTLRTKGNLCELLIDAENDHVNHYGYARKTSVARVNTSNSYHEFGTSSDLIVASGKIVIENTGVVFNVEQGDVSYTKKDGKEKVSVTKNITNSSFTNDGGNVMKVSSELVV